MKMLLAAINAKYIHSNPAIYSLRASAGPYKDQIGLGEYTINSRPDEVLADIYRRAPKVAAFSCYIWNRAFLCQVMENLHQVLPDTEIWVGGPEVSYDAGKFLEEYPFVRGVMRGEGEAAFACLSAYYLEGKETLEEIRGITFRTKQGSIRENPDQPLISMDEIPFIYEDLKDFEHKIIYYETSRGCPFSCSYCLSSIDKGVRFRSLDLVKRELQFFLDHKVPQVKFVDRTFNCNHAHAMGIWTYIKEHDNGITNFHFEIAADIFREEELKLLSGFRPGLAQLEIGVQSVNEKTIREINRVMDVPSLSRIVGKIHQGQNIHQHLDLIAGLPHEDYQSFIRSFNAVYEMRPQQLQLGFLKVLKGSKMHRKAEEYGIAYHQQPPYEVLFTKWLSYAEVLKLKAVEEMVEVYYNSQQFSHTIGALEECFPHPFALYEGLADYYGENGLNGQNHTRMKRLEILRDFAIKRDGKNQKKYEELLLLDLYLRENSKTRPAWAPDLSEYKEEIAMFYQEEAKNHALMPGYEGYSYRQLRTMTHLEIFSDGNGGGDMVLFDYKRRSHLTQDAWTYRRKR